MKSDRLQPWMSLRVNGPLLGDLTLEPMSLRALGGHRGIRVGYWRGNHTEAARGGIGEDREEPHMIIFRGHREQGGEGASALHCGENLASELANRHVRKFAKRNRLAAAK